MSNVSQNTFKIIQAANRSLELHRQKFNIKLENKNYESPKNKQLKIKNEPRDFSNYYKDLQHINNREKELDNTYIQARTIKITETKVKELEDRISNVLEYSSKLEETLRSKITNSKLHNHCCCNSNHKKKEFYEYKLISLLQEAINSFSTRDNLDIQKCTITNPYQLQIHSKQPNILLGTDDIQDLSNYILNICIEDTISNLDEILHSISLKLIQETFN